MSWDDLVASGEPCLRESPLETARFGTTVARVLVSQSATASDLDIGALVASSAADVVIVRYPAARVSLFGALLSDERKAVFADQLDYWRLRTGWGRRPEPVPGLKAVDVSSIDGVLTRELVDHLVADIFADYGNHYTANPLFDRASALAGYQEWARRMVEVPNDSATALVLIHETDPIGLATTQGAGDHREIELAGIRSQWQGRGLYSHLLAAVEAEAESRGEEMLMISTQAHNVGVRRAWARFGFEPVGAFVTAHLVRRALWA